MPDSSKLGHFNLLEEIAHGGMGTIYRAFDPTLNREVAIKVLREDLAHDPKFLNDFLQEARSAAAISHPHIVQIYFVGEEKAQYYIVMELLQGRTLREIIEQDGPIPEERALELIIDVVEGLRAAYKNKMIHGDIKPANIFITEDTGAKVLDFGLSKLANVEVAPIGRHLGFALLHFPRTRRPEGGRFSQRRVQPGRHAVPNVDRTSAVRSGHARGTGGQTPQ